MNIAIFILKAGGAVLGVLLGLVLMAGTLFVSFSPEFGGSPSEENVNVYSRSGHYEDGLFVNEVPTSMEMDWPAIKSLLRDYTFGVPNLSPGVPLPVLKIDSADIASRPDTLTRLTWFGHSAFLLEIAGKNILLDPMLGPSPSPHPWLGPGRFSNGLPIEIEQLPQIDAVIFSHDHYDHLDYGSVMKLKDKVKEFYVPLGVGAHLEAWGVEPTRIHELNWWEEIAHDDLRFVCTPARHFSGRGLTDRFTTFWSSWLIMHGDETIYFSGDSGYGPHYKQIREKYGPVDFAMLECGQYDLRWHDIHMLPEETAQAAVDLQAEVMMPIHWGSFVLALHAWDDPVKRVTAEARELNVRVTTPKIGEQVIVGEKDFPEDPWWEALNK